MTVTVNLSPLAGAGWQFFDNSGAILSGGLIYTYLAGTTTPAATYTTSAGNVACANPIVLNSAGRTTTETWLDATLSYKFVLKTSAGVTIDTYDNLNSHVISAGSYATLALATAAFIASGALFVQTQGYYSPGDGGGAVYVPSTAGAGAGKFQSADGQWWILGGANLNVLQFGADKTGVSSAVTAFSNAIGWVNARGSNPSTAQSPFTTQGFTIGVPAGLYKLDSSLTAITVGAVFFVGTRASILSISATGSLFTWSGGAISGGMLGGFTYQYPANPASTAVCITVSKAFDLIFENPFLVNVNTFLGLGTDASHIASAITVTNPIGGVYNSGQPTIDCRWGSDLKLHNVDVFVAGVDVPTFDRTSTMTTVANTNFLNFTNGGWDFVAASGNCDTNRYWRSVNVNAPGSVITNLYLDGAVFDFNSDDAVHLEAPVNATGEIGNVSIQNAFLDSWSGHGVSINGGVTAEQIDLSGTHIFFAGKHGVYVTGDNTQKIKMNDMTVSMPNRLNGGTYAGIRVDTILGNWECIGTQVLVDPTFGSPLPWPGAYYGIDIAANNIDWTVTGCNMVGTSKNYNVASDSVFSGSFLTQRIMNNNLKADYQGLQSSSPFTLPATTVAWRNTTPWTVLASFGGTGMTDIGIDGTGDFQFANGQVTIPPGHQFVPFYTGTPHVLFFVNP